jgi:hypothetical protein
VALLARSSPDQPAARHRRSSCTHPSVARSAPVDAAAWAPARPEPRAPGDGGRRTSATRPGSTSAAANFPPDPVEQLLLGQRRPQHRPCRRPQEPSHRKRRDGTTSPRHHPSMRPHDTRSGAA